MESLNYFALPVQTNVYGLSCLYADDCNKVLVATLQRQVFCVEFRKGHKPTLKEVQFTYIPSDAEIISLDTFKRPKTKYDFVVGITFVKAGTAPLESAPDVRPGMSEDKYYFNIYASWSPLSEFNIDYIAQGCLTLEIDFVPYHLYHTCVRTNRNNEDFMWLLSGSDMKIHCYRENKDRQCFVEEPANRHFPEFENLCGIVIWMDVHQVEEDSESIKRWSVVGCENGSVRVSLVEYNANSKECKVLKTYENEFDNPVTSVRLFRDQSFTTQLSDVNLLVVNSLDGSHVFRNLLTNGIDCQVELPESKRLDCSVTSCISDVNFDGFEEILIGTFGRELLMYKYNGNEGTYTLQSVQLLSRPLQAIAYMDMTGDGLKELLLLTNKGLHVLQHNLSDVKAVVEKRIKEIQLETTNHASSSSLMNYFSR